MFLTNTFSGKKEKFIPLQDGLVTLYSCGPTVYDYAHIGNFRSFLMADLLFRALKYEGYEVKKIQNITDVGHLTQDDLADADGEDKIQKKAKAEKKDPIEIARFFEEKFIEDEAVLKIIPPASRPRATEFIAEQTELINQLLKNKMAYRVGGSIYFRVSAFDEYGKLSKNSLENLQAGARVEVNDEKENPLDFALWKKGDERHLMQWDFFNGEKIPLEKISESPTHESWGFPGWHIECSAMSWKLLGRDFDIHTGGEDNIFPHHECEIAQNWGSHGGKINYWLHAKHLLVDGKKMSKSAGNFYTIRDLIQRGWTGEEIRLALISAHYRSELNFTKSSLEQARNSLHRLREAWEIFDTSETTSKIDELKPLIQKYRDAIADDLHISEALSGAFEIIAWGFQKREKNELTPEESGAIKQFLTEDFNPIFAVLPEENFVIPQAVTGLLESRKKARENKDFTESDRLRDEIAKLGFEVLDEKDGQRVRKN